MPIKKAYLILSIALVAMLCVAQVFASTLMIMLCMVAFLALVGWSCSENFTLPILLFFLPWSQLLKLTPTGYTFFTFGLVLACGISIIKKRFHFRKYPIAAGIILLFFTLLSKILDGGALSFDYIAFIMLIVCFPVVKGEWTVKKYDFYHVVLYFSLGVILAALCALSLTIFPNIARYIQVDSYSTITRRSGFYGDANFYSAQITAAMSGCLLLVIKERKAARAIFLGIITVFLLYCGFLSGSKSFVLITSLTLLLWLASVLKLQDRTKLKIGVLIGFAVIVIIMISSAQFSDLLDIIATRFSYSKDLDSLTTGRTDLWLMYIKEIVSDVKVFFLGKGYTNVKVEGRGSHNTLLQAVFQFGMVGVPVLLYWIGSFFRGASRKGRRKRIPRLEAAVMLIGTFIPWLAIDALFFDEFFLLQWYAFCALQQLTDHHIPTEDTYGRTDKNQ